MRKKRNKNKRFFAMGDDAVTVARRLLGQRLVRVIDGRRLAGIIVEVEAYLGECDPASHTFGGRRTQRVESMYLPGGHAYVYFTYGAHHCLNVVCGKKGDGVAVLIRALEPTEGIEEMMVNRRGANSSRRMGERELCSGPGKLTQALAIDRRLDGIDLRISRELFVEEARVATGMGEGDLKDFAVAKGLRIGLNPTARWPAGWKNRQLRYFLRDNPHVSH